MLNIDELLPTAKDIRKQSALKEAEKADEHMRLMAAAEAEKQALIDELSKAVGPFGRREGQTRFHVIQRAVRNGLHEVQVYRFPERSLYGPRSSDQPDGSQAGKTRLPECPKEIFQLWKDYLQPRGYKIAYQIIDFPVAYPAISASR